MFETALGWCGLAWGRCGYLGVQLPEGDRLKTAKRLERRFPDVADGPPPDDAEALIKAIQTHMSGQPADLSFASLDFEGVAPFNRRVYAITLAIRSGRTRTYGEIAEELGDKAAARAVGRALGENPWPIIIPCHRVLGAGGKIGGFSAPGGRTTKARLLQIERARTGNAPGLFDSDLTFSLPPLKG